ncbi:MAG: imidazolonepropionase [Firmicutes bacterium]|jgi:imidazolonepropionase|nr:imidazolonepropionase [Bacillota bacterium]
MRTEPSELLLIHAAELATCAPEGVPPGPRRGTDLGRVGIIPDGAIACAHGRIVDIGPTREVLSREPRGCPEIIDASGKTVLPGFVDAHTHLVFAGTRHEEHIMRIQGAKYLDILSAGGGIISTVEATRKASFEDLQATATKRLDTVLLHGTTTLEAKSGYGLDLTSELKQLEVLRAASCKHPVEVVSTLLAAHAVPPEFEGDVEGYLDFIIREVLPAVASRRLAEFCDVFCEEGVFSTQQAERLLLAAQRLGLRSKLHADEINPIGGAELAASLGAVSADHLAAASRTGMDRLAEAGVVAVLLPATMFTLMSDRYADARGMIDRGVAVALATDFNPGTSPVPSMQFVLTLACLEMKMTPAEAVSAATVNAAWAIGRGDRAGSLSPGRPADFIVVDVPALDALPFQIGVNCVTDVVKGGRVVVKDGRRVGSAPSGDRAF